MARQDTHTLQVWPSGQTYTYRGDPFAPSSNRRSLRRSGSGEAETRWRRGTPDEWQMIRVELRAERIAEQEIYACDSALVDALIRASLSSQATDQGADGTVMRRVARDTVAHLPAETLA